MAVCALCLCVWYCEGALIMCMCVSCKSWSVVGRSTCSVCAWQLLLEGAWSAPWEHRWNEELAEGHCNLLRHVHLVYAMCRLIGHVLQGGPEERGREETRATGQCSAVLDLDNVRVQALPTPEGSIQLSS